MTSSAIVTAEACGFLLVLEPPLPVSRKGRCRSASRFDLETADLHDSEKLSGIIALQLHQGPAMEVYFRHLEIKVLKAK